MNYTDAGYIYTIRNKTNGKMYIGSSVNYKSRWHTHRSALRRGIHHSFVLQKAWVKHGESAFDFEVLVVCPKNQLIEYEKRLMNLESYNILRTPKEMNVRGGWHHSEEFRAKISAVHKGKKLSDEHKLKISQSKLGRKHNEDFCVKARKRQLGISPAKSTRQKLSAALKLARQAEKQSNLLESKRIYDLAASGVPFKVAFDGVKFTRTTFYACCKELGLKPLKRKRKTYDV